MDQKTAESIKRHIKSREAIFSFIISVLMCSAFWLPYMWVLFIGIPLFGLFHGIKNWEANTGSTKNIAFKAQIGLLCGMILVVGLAKVENFQTEKEIEPYVKEFEKTAAHQTYITCTETCKEVYGFQLTKPSTWHLFGNDPYDRCMSECGQSMRSSVRGR